jgi:hypothetical protein
MAMGAAALGRRRTVFGIVPEPEAAAPTASSSVRCFSPAAHWAATLLWPSASLRWNSGWASSAPMRRAAALAMRSREGCWCLRRTACAGARVGLGYLEGLLRQRFGGSQAEAVGTVIDFAQKPVTLQQLQTELVEVGPRLTGGARTKASGRRSRRLANLVVSARRHAIDRPARAAAARHTRLEAGRSRRRCRKCCACRPREWP